VTTLLNQRLLAYSKDGFKEPRLLTDLGDAFIAERLWAQARFCFETAHFLDFNPTMKMEIEKKVQFTKSKYGTPLRQEQVAVGQAFFRPLSAAPSSREVIANSLRSLALNSEVKKRSISQYLVQAKVSLENFLDLPGRRNRNDFYLRVLRKFGSYTPLMDLTSQAPGGGYYLCIGGKGIIIDPGYNFIRNFRSASYTLKDIDAIFVTHAHDDHMADLIGLNSLLFRRQPSNQREDHVELYWSKGAKQFFSGSGIGKRTDKNFFLVETGVLEHPPEPPTSPSVRLNRENIDIWNLPTKHQDLVEMKAIGLAMRIRRSVNEHATFVFSSDTGWFDGLKPHYEPFRGCDLLLLHIGSIHPNEVLILDPSVKEEGYLYPKHLGLIGAFRLIEFVQPKMVLIGEYGEELGGLEDEVAMILQHFFPHIPIRPATLFAKHFLFAKDRETST
jgi:L-ascorbate metabolism protein UlaG (beta-lactamase superfamily)